METDWEIVLGGGGRGRNVEGRDELMWIEKQLRNQTIILNAWRNKVTVSHSEVSFKNVKKWYIVDRKVQKKNSCDNVF